jgi:hypothetical protein
LKNSFAWSKISLNLCSKQEPILIEQEQLGLPFFPTPKSLYINKLCMKWSFLSTTSLIWMFRDVFCTVFSNEISARLALTINKEKPMFRICCIWNWRLNYSVANIFIQLSRSLSWLYKLEARQYKFPKLTFLSDEKCSWGHLPLCA